MLEYEATRPLFQFNCQKILKDVGVNSNWTMVEFMHQEVIRATKVTMGATCMRLLLLMKFL